jgi:hypothetical protein
MYNTYVFAGIAVYGHSNHNTDITIEFTLKNYTRTYITLVCLLVLHIWSLRSQNRHHHSIPIKKLFQNTYNTCVFAGIAIYGHSDHKTDIIVEFTLENCSRTYIALACLLVLPYMVTQAKSDILLHRLMIHSKNGSRIRLNHPNQRRSIFQPPGSHKCFAFCSLIGKDTNL